MRSHTHFGCHRCPNEFQIKETTDTLRDLAHDTNVPTASKVEDGTIKTIRSVGSRCLQACEAATVTVRGVAEDLGHTVINPGDEGWEERLSNRSTWLPSDYRTPEQSLDMEYVAD